MICVRLYGFLQSAESLRSEEYRLLFRLPSDEVSEIELYDGSVPISSELICTYFLLIGLLFLLNHRLRISVIKLLG